MGASAGQGLPGPTNMWTIKQPDGSVSPGWYLMPLRLFLGVTFLFAGLQKLANPNFFNASSPISIHSQLVGASHASPIHALTVHLVPIASAVGAVIAVGEVAIGVGVLVGMWMRVAAVAGMALSFGLFLTVSFHASPYFTGADIVFFFAWTPIALAGAAGAPALDTWAAQHVAGDTQPDGAVTRRQVLSRGALTGMVAAVVVLGAGIVAALGRAASGTTTSAGSTTDTLASPSTQTSSTQPSVTQPSAATAPAAAATSTSVPAGKAIGSATGVPVGGSASFTDPKTGDPSLVIQQTADEFVAFDAVCPHAGCTVAYQSSARLVACPCHGSEFNARTGAVIRGPATRGLTSIKVIRGANGDLYVPE